MNYPDKTYSMRRKLLKLKILLFALVGSLVIGLLCSYFYKDSPKRSINISEFQYQLNLKENQAEKTIGKMVDILVHTSVDSLNHLPFGNNEISYYVFNKNELAFWSDNHFEVNSDLLSQSADWQLIQLPNAICIRKIISLQSTKILALIKIKNNYSYENDELVNSFAKGFNLDKQIQVLNGSKTDKYAVVDPARNYLFSLTEPKTPVFNELWAFVGLIAYSLSFLFFFILYANSPVFLKKRTFNLKSFVLIASCVGAVIALLLYFSLPPLLFLNKLFTPFQYAANPLLTSISHLTVLTVYFISTICLFYFYCRINISNSLISQIIIQVFCVLYFILVYYILSGLIYHSSIQISILGFNDFKGITLWIHILILLWGIGLAMLFFKTHSFHKKNHPVKQTLLIDVLLCIVFYFCCLLLSPSDSLRIIISFSVLWLTFYLYFIISKRKNIYSFSAIWLLMFTAFFVWNSLTINSNKKFDKYKILAQNIYINGSSENDRMADILLEELDVKISHDRKVGKILTQKDSILVANDYLNRKYLRGFWNKYDMRLNLASVHSELYRDYSQFISKVGNRIKDTHFYRVPANENNMSYIGQFQSNYNRFDSVFFFMEFYPRRNYKSYSFPNLLIANSADIQTQLNISIAKYEHNRLVYSSGTVEYSPEPNWIPKSRSEFFTIMDKGRQYYIYRPNSTAFIVISEQELYEPITYFLYFVYTFLAFFAACCFLIWGYYLTREKWVFRLGLTAKFQYAFIILLIISFIGIFMVSVNFIENKYQEQQVANLESKKIYIQKALQDMYYWNQDLNSQNSQSLNFNLQDLSYIYHTDIHVYDNRGVLIGSSQPVIFNKNLISTRISPTPYFNVNSNMNQYEHIGKLSYLTGYIDFVNGDFLQIGYIAIPQFYSRDEIKAEIESFLSVIVHIYLIIIILAILLSLFIGKQLSAPLIMLENKLKDMRLGRRNEKIDYNLNDEIGQLVIQYNRTVDELEQSAKLLAKSERESAWKSMARQVAHEINNPLTPMKLTIQQLQRTKKMDDKQFDNYFTKSTAMLIEQIDNLSRIAGTFSDFARMPEASFERIDIAARLYSVVQLFANNNEHVQIDYQGVEDSAFVYADPEQMVRVFNNLLKNAIQAIPDHRDGIIEVRLWQEDTRIIIEITDNGTGIDNELRDRLFVPNFTTKSTGMGLGLTISKNIIEISGGTISFTSNLNEGTTFTITLPKAD